MTSFWVLDFGWGWGALIFLGLDLEIVFEILKSWECWKG